MRSIKVGDVVRHTLEGYPNVDVFTVLEVREIVIDDSCSWEHVPALELIVWWDGHVCVERLRLHYLENEYYAGSSGRVLRTEIL